ncbi:hypothetical protein HZU75_08125 [Chitinibacter fontanus]|uniref:Uncharacterized protein n=1 Tax=Chitinibacter fontanus TaxID=1737446 RepID=A0A7D5V9B1_9NEIS|nr:hypothetical protein [Chitinibacter fontanus]QLI81497.1 hypothetical protein HZU75_08125 [Chitinibacter fontanus]
MRAQKAWHKYRYGVVLLGIFIGNTSLCCHLVVLCDGVAGDVRFIDHTKNNPISIARVMIRGEFFLPFSRFVYGRLAGCGKRVGGVGDVYQPGQTR